MFEFSMDLQRHISRHDCPALSCSDDVSIQGVNYHFVEDEERWIGCLRKHPDFWAEGSSFADLQSNLRKLFFDLALVQSLKDGRVIQLPPLQ